MDMMNFNPTDNSKKTKHTPLLQVTSHTYVIHVWFIWAFWFQRPLPKRFLKGNAIDLGEMKLNQRINTNIVPCSQKNVEFLQNQLRDTTCRRFLKTFQISNSSSDVCKVFSPCCHWPYRYVTTSWHAVPSFLNTVMLGALGHSLLACSSWQNSPKNWTPLDCALGALFFSYCLFDMQCNQKKRCNVAM